MTEERVHHSQDAETHALRAGNRSTVLFLAGGLAMGAAAALLFAPSSGKKTRKDLSKAVEEGLHTGRDAVGPAVKQLEKELADLRKRIEERASKQPEYTYYPALEVATMIAMIVQCILAWLIGRLIWLTLSRLR